MEISKGDVRAVYVQLEYNLAQRCDGKGDWTDIARFDHNPSSEEGHDIRREGLHMDIVHPNGDDRKTTHFAPGIKVNSAPGVCEDYFDKNNEKICRKYANWKGLRNWDWRANEIPNL